MLARPVLLFLSSHVHGFDPARLYEHSLSLVFWREIFPVTHAQARTIDRLVLLPIIQCNFVSGL